MEPAPEQGEPDARALYFSPTFGWPGGVVPVCFPGHVPDDHWPKLIRWVLEDTWSAAANIQFTGFDDCTNHQGRYVEVTYVSGRPHEQDGPRTQVRLPFNENIRTVSGIEQSYIRQTIIHEFGHALGFIHEHQRPDFVAQSNGGNDPACPADRNDLANWQPIQGGRYLTPIDRQSIMSYCSTLENLTASDRAGAASVYGPPQWKRSAAGSLLWHANDGRLEIWLFTPNGSIVKANPQPRSPMLGSLVVATGDFNGDGLGDVVWRATNGGDTRIWLMNSGSIEGHYAPPDPGPSWYIAGSGDFDGDGRSELVWQSRGGDLSIWSPTFQRALGQFIGWGVVAVGDYDGDRRSDLLMRSNGGDIAVWPLAVAQAATIVRNGVPDEARVAGSGDFDGDGRSEVVFLRTTTGEVSQWSLASGQARTTGTLAPGWFIAGIGDFDADGASDLLLRNTSGQNSVSFRAGLTGQTGSVPVMTPNWGLAGTLLDRAF